MTNLSDFFTRYDHFWITNRNKQTESELKKERVYYIEMGHFKKPWTYLRQLGPVLKIFVREKPTHVLSTGSGRTALLPFLLARLFKEDYLHRYVFPGARAFQVRNVSAQNEEQDIYPMERSGKRKCGLHRAGYSNSSRTAINAMIQTTCLSPVGYARGAVHQTDKRGRRSGKRRRYKERRSSYRRGTQNTARTMSKYLIFACLKRSMS